jgi:hypothetical protein
MGFEPMGRTNGHGLANRSNNHSGNSPNFETPTGFEPASVQLHDYNGRFRRPMCYRANI